MQSHFYKSLYPHNYKNSYVKQEYLPSNLRGKKYYHPRDNKYENNLNKLWHERKADILRWSFTSMAFSGG